MAFLMVISAVGFLVSLVVHVGALLGVEVMPAVGMRVLHYGLFVLYLPVCLAAQRLRGKYGKKEFGEVFKKARPEWMATATGFVILYTVIGVVVQLVRKADLGVAYSAVLMAGYCFAIGIYYSCRRLGGGQVVQ